MCEDLLKTRTTRKSVRCKSILKMEEAANEKVGSPKNMAEANDVGKKITKEESVDQLKSQLGMLMNSLATLSAEKSKMEANFQADKKHLRSEREECENVIKDLKEKLKRAQSHIHSEVEHVKYKLIMERHEREKEQADHSAMIKELQRLLNNERRAKEQLEQQLKEVKNQVFNKVQNKILEAELEVVRNKLQEAESAAKETPPLLLSLQAEMAAMKQQHHKAISEEQKRAAAAEQQARALAMTHEARVVSLEARLAELSEIVGEYDRLRLQDQQAIQKLKTQLTNLHELGNKSTKTNLDNDSETIAAKIKVLYGRLLDLENKENNVSCIKELLNNLNLREANEDVSYKEKYELLQQEFEEYRQQTMTKDNFLKDSQNVMQRSCSAKDSDEKEHSKVQLSLIKTHCKNLEERVRVLNAEVANKETEAKMKLEYQQQLQQEERRKYEKQLLKKDSEFRGRISALEQQLLRQRQRSVALIEEKEQEIITLKTSFQALLPKKESVSAENSDAKPFDSNVSEPAADLVTGLLNKDSPPMLHYAQELARREVQVSGLRKSNTKLEATLREKQRELFHEAERHKGEVSRLQAQIERLEACKSREGANLEYLKNVFVNYLSTSDTSSKRHMLNAISTLLRFTPDEVQKIRRFK
ncbi:GRIP and coiled-coil domain-containing protein 1 [Orussus abietinus]|uniref:GRIP and coiled-coil domain-containing protein 1 n=1 Tax=Orussus abietinus TaxID=222816 RepID=UPI0006263F95|nr:GRIP and coiled-coil domain-containing protein 1 [Orussus abietinus]